MNKEKTKKKFNKKLMIPLLVVLTIGIVAALGYYAIYSTTINFTQPIQTSGLTSEVSIPVGQFSVLGSPITVSNNGETERTIVVSNDNSNPNVKVSYNGQLVLSHKDLTSWVKTGELVTIDYTMIGDKFSVSNVPSGYVAVYYPNTDSYETGYTGAVVLVNDVISLPVSDDLNGNSLTSDYLTNTFNPDATQAVGAKIWLVPTSAVTNNVIDWNQASSFYFETSLIQFNTVGNIVISPHSSVTFTPLFTVDEHSSNITGLTITTQVA